MEHRKKWALVATASAAVVAAVISAGAVDATVIRIDNGNTWTVGKGDVQSLFGWNAKTTDSQFQNVSFRYEKIRHSDVVCDYVVAYDETWVEMEVIEEWVGGVKNRRLVTRTVTKEKQINHRLDGSFDDVAIQAMYRTLQYEMKKNAQGNVVGATIWPGGSSTTVDIATACDASKIDLESLVLPTEVAGSTVVNVRLLGTVQATEVARTITETIHATGPVMTATKSGAMVASGASMTGMLWTSQDKWVQEPPTTTTVAGATTITEGSSTLEDPATVAETSTTVAAG